MIDIVWPGIRRDDQQRSPRTIAATSLSDSCGIGSAESRTGESVVIYLRLVNERIYHVIVPVVRVVIGDDNRRVFPEWAGLDGVDGVHDESLLVQRIGVSRVSIESGLRFQEAHGG